MEHTTESGIHPSRREMIKEELRRGLDLLRMLRDEGLLEVGRGRAITVAGTPERGVVIAKMKELIELGGRNGYRRDELVEMMQTLPG